jgi:hypothetical protein
MEKDVTIKLIPTGNDCEYNGEMAREYIEVSVYYHKGGFSMSTYEEQPRGFWVSVSKIRKGKVFISRRVFEGRKMFLLEVKRFSEKKMKEAIEKAKEVYPDMVKRVYGMEVEK